MKNIFRKSALIVLAAAAMTGCIKVIEPQEGTADVNQVGSAPNAIQNYVDAVTRSICGKLYFGSSYAYDLGLPGMMLARDVSGYRVGEFGYRVVLDVVSGRYGSGPAVSGMPVALDILLCMD